uniref:Uncharacterized protein n=1 Tax=Phaseolus vulgaris TaxID=3885 RepID=I7APL9_PHAVU|nr:uncharacterized protein [Phaseolus vulgaris]
MDHSPKIQMSVD